MIDIHCHILPGLDDGPQHLKTSTAMASIAAENGTKVIIATPHTDGVRVNHDTVPDKVRELNSELERLSIPLEILPGYEIPYHLVPDLAATHTLAGSKYVLIEFPHTYVPSNALGTLYDLIDKGLLPVIAHPERNSEVLAEPDLLANLIDAGALVQLTAASITGELGPDIQQCSVYLLINSMVHFIATDSHSPSFRKPTLRKAYDLAAKLLGPERADFIAIDNPGKILSA